MVKKFLLKGKKILTAPQSSIFSAASIIMVMIAASKVLGFIRQRTLFAFFAPQETDLFLAAFELPDLIFQVFVYGVLSAAFIPVFTSFLSRKKEKDAWYITASSLNILLTLFLALGLFIFIFAAPIYTVVAGSSVKTFFGVDGGYSADQIAQVVKLARILLFAQLFFVVSSFMTGILESYKRFLIPAIAPLFYNLGIILGTILLSPKMGLIGPTVGAVFGAGAHFLVQAPFAYKLGFRPKFVWDLKHKGVKKLLQLAFPRVIELSFFQARRLVWLFLASLIPGGFTYLKSGDLLQALPIGVFGLSLAKAALPTLSQNATKRDYKSFRRSFFATLNQILFLVVPSSVFLAVLRIPIVRLVFGAQRFDWPATVQTGYVLSSFAIGIFAYAGILLVSRGYYALHDTKTPVVISLIAVVLNAVLGFIFVLGLGFDTWGIALSYSFAGIFQFVLLIYFLLPKVGARAETVLIPLTKTAIASVVSGGLVFFLLKIFDRSVWVKRLSFLGAIESTKVIPFESFVVDTRYTGNLLMLTMVVLTIGVFVFLGSSIILRNAEAWTFFNYAKRIITKRKSAQISKEEQEPVAPTPTDITTT
jgi:putative peptidoglycan lipid II flippase